MVVIPVWCHPEPAGDVFRSIAGAGAVDLVSALSMVGPLVLGIGSLALLLQILASKRKAALEWASLILILLLAPPLIAFAIYFAFLHSTRHLIRNRSIIRILHGRLRLLAASLGGAIFCIVVGEIMEVDGASALLPGLFGLTVPHVLLELLESRSRSRTAH